VFVAACGRRRSAPGETRFLRRLRADVGEFDHFAQLHNPACAAMAVDQRVDVS
jgi:hypothetical protein